MKFRIRSFRLCRLIAISVLLLGFTNLSLQAQTDTGRVTGVVEDTTAASIPGATITIENTETAAKQTTTTDAEGNFNFSAMPRGLYKITATMSGFQTTTQNFELQVSQTQTIAFRLNVSTSNETIEVTSAAPIIDLSTSSVGEVVAGRQVTDLPLNGRNFTQLALLTPWVTRGNYGNSAS